MSSASKIDKICLDSSCTHPFVSRDEWGAWPPKNGIEEQRYALIDGPAQIAGTLRNIVIHHSAFRSTDSPNFIQGWSLNHGYDDIPYHFYITEDGTIYEGRPLSYMGAHAGRTKEAEDEYHHDLRLDPDYGSIGIALAGCFDDSCKERHTPTADQKDALLLLIMSLRLYFPNIETSAIMAHSDVKQRLILDRGLTPVKEYDTACPGDFSSEIADIRDQIAGLHLDSAGGIRPFSVLDPQTQTVIKGVHFHPENVDMRIILGGGMVFDQKWMAAGKTGAMINGGYFGRDFKPKGLMVIAGKEISEPETVSPYSGLFSVDTANKWSIRYLKDSDGNISIPQDAFASRVAFQAGPVIIEPGGKDGIPEPKTRPPQIFRRTIIASSKRGEWFLIATGEISLFNLQGALHMFVPDIDAALNLDGGPSSALAAEGAGIMMEPASELPILLHVRPK